MPGKNSFIRRIQAWVFATVLVILASASLGQPCTPHFVPGYNGPTISGSILCAAMFDDGSGPVLIAGGTMKILPSMSTAYLAKFAQGHWTAIAGPNSAVQTLLVRSESGHQVLYAGGVFTSVSGQASAGVAKWNGQAWSPLPGLTLDGALVFGVTSLAFFNDGSGDSLYAAGNIHLSSPVTYGIAKLTGSSWQPVSGGISGPNQLYRYVRSLLVFDDGSGPKLFIAGSFSAAGGVPCLSLATWNGQVWQDGSAGFTPGSRMSDVYALAVHDVGGGPKLYAAGQINMMFPTGAPNVGLARLDSTTWTRVLGTPEISGASALLSCVDDHGSSLYVAPGITSPSNIRALSDGQWRQLHATPSEVKQLLMADTGEGSKVIAVGAFQYPPCVTTWEANPIFDTGDVIVPIEHWGRGSATPFTKLFSSVEADGTYWADGVSYRDGVPLADRNGYPLPAKYGLCTINVNGFDCTVVSGPAWLVPSDIAIRDQNGWSPMAMPELPVAVVTVGEVVGRGSTLLVATSGLGNARVWARNFQTGTWEQMGPDVPRVSGYPTIVSMTCYDDGHGAAIYISGIVSGSTSYLLRLSNDQWVPVSGVDGVVNDFATFDFGQGPELVMAGDFTNTNGITDAAVARWNGTRVQSIGFGFPSTAVGNALSVFNSGQGPTLYLGLKNDSNPVRFWNGASWSSVGAFSAGATVNGFAKVRRPDGSRSLFIGGSFVSAGGTFSTDIAEFTVCPIPCTTDFNNDGDSGTDADIEAFFACLSGNCCPTCPGNADFNADGDVGTDADIESFFRVLAGGSC